MTREQFLRVLSWHVGQAYGITASELAGRCDITEREVRRHVSELRDEGIAVCAHPRTGYFIAQTPAELDMACNYLRRRALHSLTLESRMRKISMAELLGQIKVPT